MELKYKWAADYAPELPDIEAKQSVKLKSDYTANGTLKTPSSLSPIFYKKNLIHPIKIALQY